MPTHLVCSPQRSFKTEMYFCEFTHTDCSVFLPENASCNNMSFFLCQFLWALQSSMMNKVGEPAYLLKKHSKQLLQHLFSIWCYWINYSYTFVFWVLHVTNPSPVFICFVPFYGGQSMTIFSKKKYLYIPIQVNLVQTLSFNIFFGYKLLQSGHILETQ